MEFKGTIKRVVTWSNKKGQFFAFEERPENFWKWGIAKFREGDKVNVVTVEQKLGASGANYRISEMLAEGEKQLQIAKAAKFPDTIIEQAAKSANAAIAISEETAKGAAADFTAHIAIATQAEKIVELRAAIDKLISRVQELERDNKTHFARENVLQSKCGASFL